MRGFCPLQNLLVGTFLNRQYKHLIGGQNDVEINQLLPTSDWNRKRWICRNLLVTKKHFPYEFEDFEEFDAPIPTRFPNSLRKLSHIAFLLQPALRVQACKQIIVIPNRKGVIRLHEFADHTTKTRLLRSVEMEMAARHLLVHLKHAFWLLLLAELCNFSRENRVQKRWIRIEEPRLSNEPHGECRRTDIDRVKQNTQNGKR